MSKELKSLRKFASTQGNTVAGDQCLAVEVTFLKPENISQIELS